MISTPSQLQTQSTRTNKGADPLKSTFKMLHQFIEEINAKIVNRLQLVQQTYCEDYKVQVQLMSDQLRRMRVVLDEQLLRQRASEKLFILEEERDFFREQVMQLNLQVGQLTKSQQKLKIQLEERTAQAKDYQAVAQRLQKRIQKMEDQFIQIDNVKRSAGGNMQSVKNIKNQRNSRNNLNINFNDKNGSYPFQINKANAKAISSLIPNESPLKHGRSQSLQAMTTSVSTQASTRNQIIDKCIKQVKRSIFYRTLDMKQANKVHFDEAGQVPFTKFTKTDRKKLLEMILGNSTMLQQFYQFIARPASLSSSTTFQQPNSHQHNPLLNRTHKALDARFNTRQVNEARVQFSKKIYQLKTGSTVGW